MRAHRATHRVRVLCRVLAVSASGYYAWLGRPVSKRAQVDADLSDRIRAIHARSRGTYGVPRVHAELVAEKIALSRNRVARLMQAGGLQGVSGSLPGDR